MDVTQINTKVLRKLLELTERKEQLLEQVARIESDLLSLSSGKATISIAAVKAPVAKAVKPAKAAKAGRKSGGKRGRRGALKEQILSILNAAGEAGARVKDIASQLGANPQNIHVWFSSTGKKLGEITRVDAGHYKIAAPKAKTEKTATPAAPKKVKAKKKKTGSKKAASKVSKDIPF